MDWTAEYPRICKLYLAKSRFGDGSIHPADDDKIGKLVISLSEMTISAATNAQQSPVALALDPVFNAKVTTKVIELKRTLFVALAIDDYPTAN